MTYMELRTGQLPDRIKTVIFWAIGAFIMGIITGLIGVAFNFSTLFVTDIRLEHPLILLLLPVGGMLVVLIYKAAKLDPDPGVNGVLGALQDGRDVPLRMFPLIFFAAVFSHFCGASVGRTGTTLQLGGSLGNFVGRLLKLGERHRKTLIMCCMGGVFSAFFGTPLAGCVFAMELAVVGYMPLYALLPCTICSYTARFTGIILGYPNTHFSIDIPSGFLPGPLLHVVLLSAIAGLVAILYIVSLQNVRSFVAGKIKNPYLRAFIFGAILLALTFLVGEQHYNGLGNATIAVAYAGGLIFPAAFLLKILFTSISGITGYKGGEIFPAIFIGATLGAAYGNLVGFSPAFCAAIGVGGLFCGITNCPVTSFLLCMEFFGFDGAVYFLPAIAVSYLTSGYFGIYTGQKFAFSKYRMKKLM